MARAGRRPVMWTPENRPKYDRSKLRSRSDRTDEEGAIMGPLIPPAKRGGNKRTIDERAVVNGVMYILSTGCQWAALPKDLPPRSTVNDYLRRWDEDRTLDRIHHALYVLCRERAGRGASPTAAIIDSQSVKPDLNSAIPQVLEDKAGNEIQPCLWCQRPVSAVQPPSWVCFCKGIPTRERFGT